MLLLLVPDLLALSKDNMQKGLEPGSRVRRVPGVHSKAMPKPVELIG